jgi:hypothetical protein
VALGHKGPVLIVGWLAHEGSGVMITRAV